jgi:hypothetical protein
MSNPFSRFFTPRRAAIKDAIANVKAPSGGAAAVQELLTNACSVGPPPPVSRMYSVCAGCGGYFQPEKLKPIYRGTTTLLRDGNVSLPHFESVYDCQRCEPPAPIIFALLDTKGETLDTRFFQVGDGWFQDVDEGTGEDRYTVSLEEYTHTFCIKCGVLNEETECRGCRKKTDKAKK